MTDFTDFTDLPDLESYREMCPQMVTHKKSL